MPDGAAATFTSRLGHADTFVSPSAGNGLVSPAPLEAPHRKEAVGVRMHNLTQLRASPSHLRVASPFLKRYSSSLITFSSFSSRSLVVFAYLAPLLDMAACLDVDQPLELSDIMPTDKKHYDKMRPPKYKGEKDE